MARIIFGWEFGASLGHVYPLLRIANDLHKKEHEIIFVCRDVESAYDVIKEHGYKLIQAPLWKNPPLKNIRQIPTPSYADVIARQGFGYKQKLRSMLSSWDDLLDVINPDLIIADHSPGLSLAARKKIPMINIGNGFTLPPTGIDRYPEIITSGKALVSQDKLLKMFNELQQENGRAVLKKLPDIFDTEGQFVCTLPQLDPYDGYRKIPVVGPLEESVAPSPNPVEPHIFLYMANEAEDCDVILQAVQKSGVRTTAYIRGAPLDRQQKYQSKNMQMLQNPVNFSEMLPKTSLVIHSGGAGTATSCLMAGRPQILFPRQSESALNGQLLEKRGIARAMKRGVTVDSIGTTLDEILNDQGMLSRCLVIAQELERGDWQNALAKIIFTAEELLDSVDKKTDLQLK